MAQTPMRVMDSLIDAVNRHDLDALVEHFAEDVRSDTPAHPTRSFTGREQVRRNWGQILEGVSDLRAEIRSSAVDGDVVLAEIAFDGRRADGSPFRMRGATVNQVIDGRIVALRFYMEPVDAESTAAPGVDTVVRQAIATAGAAR